MSRRQGVTPALRELVFNRDRQCVAPLLDPNAGPCQGRPTIEHVNDQSTRAKRAPDDPQHLVLLCELHAGLLRTAGQSWNTMRENRYRLRRYLWKFYDLLCDWHECEQLATMTLDKRQLCRGHYDLLAEGLFV